MWAIRHGPVSRHQSSPSDTLANARCRPSDGPVLEGRRDKQPLCRVICPDNAVTTEAPDLVRDIRSLRCCRRVKRAIVPVFSHSHKPNLGFQFIANFPVILINVLSSESWYASCAAKYSHTWRQRSICLFERGCIYTYCKGHVNEIQRLSDSCVELVLSRFVR